ncbi:hypothetical protein C8F01DRAFT_1170515 [Mycena amicta]|nr:hypothetical protein C8F01DRAFT_1170515 [Mycena amicta]
MGGQAFSASLPLKAFPRIPPTVYLALKARITPQIETLYSIVSTPAEAPLKPDHGDLDILACDPLSLDEVAVPPEQVQALLGAEHVVPMPGNRTSSYAIRIEHGEWTELGHDAEEQTARNAAREEGQSEIYYQVDVHVCADRAEWERTHFFHAYGDLGMILGLIARNNGLALGTKGLKLPNPPHTALDLSESMEEIIQYMGLSMEHWKAGFSSALEVFEWVGASSFFDPTTFKSEGKKVKPERKMYAQFAVWAKQQKPKLDGVMSSEARVQHALVRFGKKDEYDRILREDTQRAFLKSSFNGNKIREWTGIAVQHWQDLKKVTEEVRTELGGDTGIVALLEQEGETGLRTVVLRAKQKLGIGAELADVTKAFEGVQIV